MTFYIFSPGDIAKSAEFNQAWATNLKTMGELLANGVDATYSQELVSSNLKIVDKFLDSTGQNNTVDTGNTDAVFNDYIYRCDVSTSTSSETSSDAYGSTDTTSGSGGVRVYVNSDCVLNKVTRTSTSSDATNCYLMSDVGTILATAIYSGSDAIFTPYQLSASTYYRIENYKSGSWNQKYKVGSYPYNNTYINFISESTNGSGSGGNLREIATITVYAAAAVTYIDSTLQSDTTTIPTTDDKIMLTPLMYEALAGSDALTFDYSMDNEANWETGNAVNTWIDASGATNTGALSVRLQFDTDDGSTTPKVKGWSVFTDD